MICKGKGTSAGEASSATKSTMTRLGRNPSLIKKLAIFMYEAEINAIIHADYCLLELV